MRVINDADGVGAVGGRTGAESRDAYAAAQALRAWNSPAMHRVVAALQRLRSIAGYPHCVASSDRTSVADAEEVERRVARAAKRSKRKALRRVEKGKMRPVSVIWGDAVSEGLALYLGGSSAPSKAWQCVAMFGRMAHQATLRDVYDAAEAREWNVDESEFRYPPHGLRGVGGFAAPHDAEEAEEEDEEEAPGDDDPFSDDEAVNGGSLVAAVRRDLITQQQQQLVEVVVESLDREAKRCIEVCFFYVPLHFTRILLTI